MHLVQAPTEQIADTICYYLTHEAERRRITDQAYHLVTTELTMHKAVAAILERVMQLRKPSDSLPLSNARHNAQIELCESAASWLSLQL